VGAVISDPWLEWAEHRPRPRVLHLDSAAAGRQSVATLDATAAQARLEAEVGAYVAQDQVGEVLAQLRRDVAGLLGTPPDGVAFVESATAALAALFASWPLPDEPRVGVVAVEWGPNLEAFEARGFTILDLPHDGTGRLDLGALEQQLADDPPTVVHLTQVTSHRGLVQPVAEAAALCRVAGIPLWVDAAQAIGHVDTATGADAVYATSRKWLAGPRGVGMVAIAARHWDALRIRRSTMSPADLPAVAHLESHEAHVAGRIGLATAVREYLTLGSDVVNARLDEVGRLTAKALADIEGWAVVGGSTPGNGAITALRPAAGQDVFATRARLLTEHGILTTAGSVARAPRDMQEPLLRISPHVDCTDEVLARLVEALGDR
jgi:pyridoxal 5-phosphate dependent beta-lyase